MVGKIIRDYMEAGNKKLTVPGFGTFMRKDSGEVIFVDLLRKDDGKLRELVEDYGNYGEVEAMAMVDRFTFETRTSIEKNGSAPIDGFGTMYLDDKGLYQFNYSPAPKSVQVKENPVQEELFVKEEPVQTAKTVEKQVQRPVQKMAVVEKGSVSGRPAPRPAQKRPVSAPRKKGKPSKPDMLILIAIIAAAVAILVMVFGLSATGNLPFLNK